jgi:hypothetical protein
MVGQPLGGDGEAASGFSKLLYGAMGCTSSKQRGKLGEGWPKAAGWERGGPRGATLRIGPSEYGKHPGPCPEKGG